MTTTVLIGATGNIGRASLAAFRTAGFSGVLRAASRHPQRAAQRLPQPGLEWHFFDYAQPGSYAPLLKGAQALFFIAPQAEAVPAARRLLATAAEQGLQRVVYSSGRTTGDVPGRPMHTIEAAVRASGLAWTILRPGWFMQNFTGWLAPSIGEQNAIRLPAGQARTAFVDVRDIGQVVARVLTETGHAGQTYELTGPEAFDHREVAECISRASGSAVHYEAVGEEAFRQLARGWGWSDADIEDTLYLFRLVREGKEASPGPYVERLLGRPPRSLADFCREYAGLWRTTT